MQRALLRPVIAAAIAAALTGCFSEEDSVEQYGGPTMGSTYSIKYVRHPGVQPLARLQEETDRFLAQLDQELSTYRSDSDIERFNALPAGRCADVPGSVLRLVEAGNALRAESAGALDLTLEPLLNLWGFGPKANGDQIPTDQQIMEVLQRVGHRHLHVEGARLCKTAPVELDFNSIAAGYAVDEISARLKASGVTSYLVEITGELKAEGVKPDGSPWRIAIEAPRDDERVAQRVIELDGQSISTSGDYRNYFERDGKRFSHTLDPRTGAPITHRLAAVTVAQPSALRADGLSTALMVMGPDQGFAFAERNNIPAFFVTREGQAFATKSTTAFEALFGAGGKQ